MEQLNIGKAGISVVIASAVTAADGLHIEPEIHVAHITEAELRDKQVSASLNDRDCATSSRALRAHL